MTSVGRLAGGVAIVTGAGTGLGRAEALALGGAGAAVVVNDVATDAAAAVVAEIVAGGGSGLACAGDVGDWDFAEHLVTCAVSTFGDLTILVNNAGVLRDRMIFSMSAAEWDAVLHVHLRGHAGTTRFATAHWREGSKAGGEPQWARVVNTASEAFLAGSPAQPNYAAAKAGIVALTMATAKGCARYGVTANAICPRAATSMTASNFATSTEDHRSRFAPEHVARLVNALAAPDSAVTGQVFIAYGETVHRMAAPTVAETLKPAAGGWAEGALEAALDAGANAPGFAADTVLGLADGWRPEPLPS
jgi:NAD(P)-dependent dehydrogenase (short-subunit alcohol dehydrogenase family)